jgi:hypothetical protein
MSYAHPGRVLGMKYNARRVHYCVLGSWLFEQILGAKSQRATAERPVFKQGGDV